MARYMRDDAFVGDGELLCGHCACEADLGDDSRAIGGLADSPPHCGTCHYPLYESFGLTDAGVEHVVGTVRADMKRGTRDDGWRWQGGWYEGLGRQAVTRDWCRLVLDASHRLSRRDELTLQMYLLYTRDIHAAQLRGPSVPHAAEVSL